MNKIEEARDFLNKVGMPKAQQADICCYVLLAMAGIKPNMSWSESCNRWNACKNPFVNCILLFGSSM